MVAVLLRSDEQSDQSTIFAIDLLHILWALLYANYGKTYLFKFKKNIRCRKEN